MSMVLVLSSLTDFMSSSVSRMYSPLATSYPFTNSERSTGLVSGSVVIILIRLKWTSPAESVAVQSATGQVTSDSCKWPCQLGRAAMRVPPTAPKGTLRPDLTSYRRSRFLWRRPGALAGGALTYFSSSSARLSQTLSTRPQSRASSAVMKWSRSRVSSTTESGWPVCLA